MNNKVSFKQERPWNEYPLGTKVHAVMGGYWERVKLGWKWCTGATFPTPGGDWLKIELPTDEKTECLRYSLMQKQAIHK